MIIRKYLKILCYLERMLRGNRVQNQSTGGQGDLSLLFLNGCFENQELFKKSNNCLFLKKRHLLRRKSMEYTKYFCAFLLVPPVHYEKISSLSVFKQAPSETTTCPIFISF